MIGVILLFLVTFRSVRPLVLATLAISTGMLVAFTVSIWLFDRVHLLTFVFGATLIGVSDDYALQYLCDAFRLPNWNPRDATRRAAGTRTRARNDADRVREPRDRTVSRAAPDRGFLRRRPARCVAHGRAAFAFAHACASKTPTLMRVGLAYAQRFPIIADRWVFICAAFGVAAPWRSIDTTERRCSPLAGQDPAADAEAAKIESLVADRRDNQFLLVEGATNDATLAAERSVRRYWIGWSKVTSCVRIRRSAARIRRPTNNAGTIDS
jgi:predicted exporter